MLDSELRLLARADNPNVVQAHIARLRMKPEPRVTAVRLDWMENWGNNPTFEVSISNPVDFKDMIFQWKKDLGLFFAQYGDMVYFISGDPNKPGRGYGGAKYDLMTFDGPVSVIGPWSSRAGVMNRHFEPHCLDTRYYRETEYGSVLVSGAVTLESIAKFGFEIWRVEQHGDIRYEPGRNGKRKNQEGNATLFQPAT